MLPNISFRLQLMIALIGYGLINTLPPLSSLIVPVLVNGLTRMTTVLPAAIAWIVPGFSNWVGLTVSVPPATSAAIRPRIFLSPR